MPFACTTGIATLLNPAAAHGVRRLADPAPMNHPRARTK
jgi:hypothetical protein